MKPYNFLVTGVGGQGTVVASDILAAVGLEAGYDVKKSDVLGLAVRGGSVVSHIRWGDRVHSPIVPEGQVDVLVAFEYLEGLRWLDQLRHRSSQKLCRIRSSKRCRQMAQRGLSWPCGCRTPVLLWALARSRSRRRKAVCCRRWLLLTIFR